MRGGRLPTESGAAGNTPEAKRCVMRDALTWCMMPWQHAGRACHCQGTGFPGWLSDGHHRDLCDVWRPPYALVKGVNEDHDEVWVYEECPAVLFAYWDPSSIDRLHHELAPRPAATV